MRKINRRQFIKESALASASVAAAALLSGCQTEQNQAVSYDETLTWHGEYDVIVIGYGAAGAMAAISAAKEGAGVLLIDAAPKGHEGGNTRYSGQMFITSSDYDKAIEYYRALNGNRKYDEELLKMWCDKITNEIQDIVESIGGNKSEYVYPRPAYSPEYPELSGGDAIKIMAAHEDTGDGYLWSLLNDKVKEYSNKIDVWYQSPALHLIQDPVSKTILGAQISHLGETLQIRAKNGVVLSSGGFENNITMQNDYLGLSRALPYGSLYNKGDGIRMAQEVGADLWHMDIYEGILNGMSFMAEEGGRADSLLYAVMLRMPQGSCFIVNEGGKRFYNEIETSRHGHTLVNGVYVMPSYGDRNFFICDSSVYQLAGMFGALTDIQNKYTWTADTIEELAEAAGINPNGLKETLAEFNEAARLQKDFRFNRSPEKLAELTAPFYALEVMPIVLNTQGGPRRNKNAEILAPDGTAIPNLYGAGECGGITAHLYNGGTNIAECLIFGQIAGINAAATKTEIPALDVSIKKNELKFTIGSGSSELNDEFIAELNENEYLGKGEGIGGTVYVKCTITDGTIQKVDILSHQETEGYGTKPINSMPEKFIGLSSLEEIDSIDVVTAATRTSNAIKEAVKDCLNQATK